MTSSDDGTARIWSAATGILVQTLSGPDRSPVYNAAFSRNGQLVVTCSVGAAAIWSAQTGQQLTEFQHGSIALGLRVQPGRQRGRHSGSGRADRIFSTELAGGIAQIERIAEQRAAHRSPRRNKRNIRPPPDNVREPL